MKCIFLVPELLFDEIKRAYPYPEDKQCIQIQYERNKKKTSANFSREWFEAEVLPETDADTMLMVCDAELFKVIAKVSKTDPWLGYVKKTYIGESQCMYLPSFKQLFFDPERTKKKISFVLAQLKDFLEGHYSPPGELIIHKAQYPKTLSEIKALLDSCLDKDVACDIETYSLKHPDAGIASIAFSIDQHEGFAFKVDKDSQTPDEAKRELLRGFFEHHRGRLIFHNICFDAYILTYQLYMKSLLDTEGLLKGMDVLLKNFEDTMLIAYLATNSCAGNTLGLKALAQEYTGNYAIEEIDDAGKIPEQELLQYNLVDTLATWHVFNRYWQKMVDDDQLNIYQTIFKPAVKDVIQMQLTGLPLNMQRVLEVEKILEADATRAKEAVLESDAGKDFTLRLKQEWVEDKNSKLKVKRVALEDAKIEFNINSSVQLQEFLYDYLNLPVVDKTESKLPATGADTIEKLINHTQDPEVQKILQALVDYKAVIKILTAFIPAFKAAYLAEDGRHYLFGSFHLGGTVSGRLSSSNVNLQQLPATGSKYAKVIKSCFSAADGWLLCGLDFASLEDRISALTTKDINKLKVYVSHYDGHCLRAYSYWKDKMPDITEAINKEPEREVEIINSIKHSHKDLRQRGKSPTFALTYQGNWRTLAKNFGFSPEEAKHIEAQYHELYKESDAWVQKRLDQAAKDGYVTCAFGLRVRTPKLKRTVRHVSKTPKEAEAEARTAGNALGQSWGLLNTRAGIEFNSLVRKSNYKFVIRPCAQIHDAQYFLIKDDIDALLWANERLVHAVQWQEDPAIFHESVKLGGEFSIFWPDWSKELTIPNKCSEQELRTLVNEYIGENNG